jgi:hypothetical protein
MDVTQHESAGGTRGSVPRGYEWARAGAALAMAFVPAVLSNIAFIAFDVQMDPDWLLIGWALGFAVGPLSAWSRLHGNIGDPECVTDEEVAGHTGLLHRGRWRSVRLDRLSSVSYHKLIGTYWIKHYIILCDRDGNRLMVTPDVRVMATTRDPKRVSLERLCHQLLAAIDATPGVRVSSATRRRLAGDARLSDLALCVIYYLAVFISIILAMTQIGAW